MNKIINRILITIITCIGCSASAAPIITSLHLDESSPSRMHLRWRTQPGEHYRVYELDSTTLSATTNSTFITVDSDQWWSEIPIEKQARGFLRIEKVDKQPPHIKSCYPANADVGINPFANIIIKLTDETGIDENSFTLRINQNTVIHSGDSRLSWDGETLRVSLSPLPLGQPGATITATLKAADRQGNTLNHSWAFQLKPESRTAANVNVIAAQFNPNAADSPSHPTSAYWLESITTNTLVFGYDHSVPDITVGQLLCNGSAQTPEAVFYRRARSVRHDSMRQQLIVTTEDADLMDFIEQGSMTWHDGELNLKSPTLYAAESPIDMGTAPQALRLPQLGSSFSNLQLNAYADSFAITSHSQPPPANPSTWLTAQFNALSWQYQPKLETQTLIQNGQLQAFDFSLSGDMRITHDISLNTSAAGYLPESSIITAPTRSALIMLGWLDGRIPVYAIAEVRLNIKVIARSTGAGCSSDLHFKQTHSIHHGLEWSHTRGINWSRRWHSAPPNLTSRGELGATTEFQLVASPQIDFLVFGLAGAKSTFRHRARFDSDKQDNHPATGQWILDADLAMQTTGPGFYRMNISDSFSERLWTGNWDIIPTDDLHIASHPQSQTLRAGHDITLFCIAESEHPIAYQWFHRDIPIPGATHSQLVLADISELASGKYHVRVSSNGNSQYSRAALLTILPADLQMQPPPSMAWIAAGKFTMGDTLNEGYHDETPTRNLWLDGYFIDQTEISGQEWSRIVTWATNNGYTFSGNARWKSPEHPVQNMTWFDAIKWCNARSEMTGLTPAYYLNAGRSPQDVYRQGNVEISTEGFEPQGGYRLPTEAEWEKAARGGLRDRRHTHGNIISHDTANYWANTRHGFGDQSIFSDYRFHPDYDFGTKPYTAPAMHLTPNGYGLYGMAGNVWEWCWDRYGSYQHATTNPTGPQTGSTRVMRGGSWRNIAKDSRVSRRYHHAPTYMSGSLGFRCILMPPNPND